MSTDTRFAGLLGAWPPSGPPLLNPAQGQMQGLLPAPPATSTTMGLLDAPGDPSSLFGPRFNATDLAGGGQASNDLGRFAAQVQALRTIRDQLGDPLGWFAPPDGQARYKSADSVGPAATPPSPPTAPQPLPSAADPQATHGFPSVLPLKGYSKDQIEQALSLDPDLAAEMQAANVRVLKAAQPTAVAIIAKAASSGDIDAFQKADLGRVNSLLSSNKLGTSFDPVQDEPGADGAAMMDEGVGTIDIDPASVIRKDGSIDYNALAAILAHEGRHEYDDYALGLLQNNGPQNVNEERWTEQNAWRTQAALDQAIGHGDSFANANNKSEVLLTGTVDDAAEASLKKWLDAARKRGLNIPVYPGQGGTPGK